MLLPIKYKIYNNRLWVRGIKGEAWKVAKIINSKTKVYTPITQRFGKDFIWTKDTPVAWKGRWFYKDIIGIPGHNGIDFTAPIGTCLYAPHDGKIIELMASDGKGIKLKGKEYTSVFYHLSDWACSLGDKVKAGDLIGYTGNTGRYTTGPHLHWGVKGLDNVYFDHVGLIEDLDVHKLPYDDSQCLIRTEANGEFYVVENGDLVYYPSDKQPDRHIPIVDYFLKQKDKGLPKGFIKAIKEDEFNKFNQLIK